MAQLFDDIRSAIDAERFIVSNHADDRLRERLVELWHITSSLGDAKLIAERPRDTPNPSVVVDQRLPDGTMIRVVWSYVYSGGVAVFGDGTLSRQVNMLIDGKKTRVTKWIHGDLCVARVEVDAILPSFDPSEPYLEPVVVRFLDQLQELANNGRIDELAQHGRVYVRKTA